MSAQDHAQYLKNLRLRARHKAARLCTFCRGAADCCFISSKPIIP
jgi:hypothetical protein